MGDTVLVDFFARFIDCESVHKYIRGNHCVWCLKNCIEGDRDLETSQDILVDQFDQFSGLYVADLWLQR